MSLKNRLISTAVALLVLVLPTGAKAEDGNCSNATLHGSYGLHATGKVMGGGDFAAVGRFTFDGKGGLAGKLFVRVGGNNVSVTITGTYSVSSDCTVSDVWNASGSISTHESVIVDEGKEYFIVNNTSGDGSVISGEAKRQ